MTAGVQGPVDHRCQEAKVDLLTALTNRLGLVRFNPARRRGSRAFVHDVALGAVEQVLGHALAVQMRDRMVCSETGEECPDPAAITFLGVLLVTGELRGRGVQAP